MLLTEKEGESVRIAYLDAHKEYYIVHTEKEGEGERVRIAHPDAHEECYLLKKRERET